jgi:hypothetical protein
MLFIFKKIIKPFKCEKKISGFNLSMPHFHLPTKSAIFNMHNKNVDIKFSAHNAFLKFTMCMLVKIAFCLFKLI